ncbi:MAG TPA: hypothetical protein VKT52_07750 [Ktedonobacterales bacterium]|nr:hypothetical protein [Ktedonobacterales bacterium]
MARYDTLTIGKIVRSESHVRYTCQVYGPGEVAAPPQPSDYAFGSFVRIPLRVGPTHADLLELPALPAADIALSNGSLSDVVTHAWAIGLIYDTILLNPAFGTLGPRLSNDEQVAVFSPDYLMERAVLVSILLLGTMAPDSTADMPLVSHGVPPVAPDLGAEVATLPDSAVRAFHSFADGAAGPGGPRPYLHMGYLPHAIAQDNPLLPLALLRTIERLERLLPENAALLSIVKRNFAWRLKVQTAG